MKHTRILWILLILIFSAGLVTAQDFGTLAIPDARVIPHLHYRLGADVLTFPDTDSRWHEASNVRLKFGLADYFEAGLDVYNAAITTEGVGYALSFQPLREKDWYPDILFGVRQASEDEKYVTGLGVPIESESTFSVFTSLGKTLAIHPDYPTRLLAGIGNGYFKDDHGGIAEDLSGFFGGIHQNLGIVTVAYEFSGRSNFAGVIIEPMPEFALKFAIRDIDKLSKDGYTFDEVGAFQIGLTYQAPLIARHELEQERENNARLRFQLDQCFDQLQYADVSIEQRQQQIARLRQQAADEDAKFKEYMQAEAELYRLRERVRELENRPGTNWSQINQSVNYLNNAFLYFYEEKYDQAKRECQKAIDLTPNLAMAHTRLGSIYYKQGDINNALKAWRRSLQVEPNNPQLRDLVRQLEDRN